MSGISIRSGAVVEVDTRSLRAVAVELEGLSGELEQLVRDLAAAEDLLDRARPETTGACLRVRILSSTLRRREHDTTDLAASVRRAADLYESVELLVERGFAEAAGDAAAVRRADRALAALPPHLVDAARRAIASPPDRGDLVSQAAWGAFLLGTPLAAALPQLLAPLGRGIDGLDRGRVPSGARLTGPAVPVTVPRVRSASVAPPTSLAEAARRIPGGGESRVRVERYAMPSGANAYAVYVTGTQTMLPGDDAFDMRSNVQLYAGERSASYDATVAALAAAGAQPGDVVHAFGHSQGAMVIERLALEGPYDTRTAVSFGAPVQADLGDGTLAVSLRHTDDPIAALQAGGHPGGVGAPGGFVVERLADPAPGMRDVTVPAHQMSAYVETATLVDASSDPRVESLRAAFDDLARAEGGRVEEYGATRVSPSRAVAG